MFEDGSRRRNEISIKICGICSADDALASVAFGADAIGLNGYTGSKRYINIEKAADWIGNLPQELRKVAVLVNPSFEHALAIARLPFIDSLQLHGSESPDFCRRLADEGVQFAKALPVSGPDSLERVPAFYTQWIVLDSAKAGLFGGSGTTFPWALARRFVEADESLRVILAGGLTPHNVEEAITAVRPYAVDVTSGVEAAPGRKDHARLRAFIEAARRAAASL